MCVCSLGLRSVVIVVRDNDLFFHRLFNGRCIGMMPGNNLTHRLLRVVSTVQQSEEAAEEAEQAKRDTVARIMHGDKQFKGMKLPHVIAEGDGGGGSPEKTVLSTVADLRRKDSDGHSGHSRAITCVVVGAAAAFTGRSAPSFPTTTPLPLTPLLLTPLLATPRRLL